MNFSSSSSLRQIQFGMAFLHSAQLLYTDCGYPRWSVCFTLPNAIFFYMLFNDFYKVSRVSPCAWSSLTLQHAANCDDEFHIFSLLFIYESTEILHEEGQRRNKGRTNQWKVTKWQSKRTHYTRLKSQWNGHEAEWEQERELSNLKVFTFTLVLKTEFYKNEAKMM